ncbi:LysR family transcriptional regulator [Frankia sp. AgB1.9]|uniref:LysR family transcriptional regulator n=1 Tax=unclassified Frankia TaxID=2632575 RepID=UPI00193343F4|nr:MULTISPECIES: LysR family transcriptional regulator [unclassified Frankia]MBL7488659.1 LysR family transcriptional regulator [Frankia sp. AgW1.1]MBL7551779.1 LysR family transcriptional regulator [Frankia sp. AgB1.9]MBL7621100.1 LysR family transcriptional regulator [Frankia sp. AgB1.8]
MDLDAVRTFVTAADAGQFQEAAVLLSITQQGVSKRIAALERDLEVRLFTRTARGAELTVDGQAFLPHARELLRVEARADASVRPGRRALRVDVVNRRIAPAVLLQDFYRRHPDLELDVVTLAGDTETAIRAVEAGTVDATFHALATPARQLPAAIRTARVIDEPHELLVGPRHAFANARAVRPTQLAGHRIWMPGVARGTEVAAYYDELAAAFGLTIDMVGPVFGNEALLDEIADSAELSTLVGANSRYLWPDSYDLRRIPVRDPAPIYPLSLIWRGDNPHPALASLRSYLDLRRTDASDTAIWLPRTPPDQPPDPDHRPA